MTELLDDQELIASLTAFIEESTNIDLLLDADIVLSKEPYRPRRPRHVEIRMLRDEIVQLEALHQVLQQRRCGSGGPTTSEEGVVKWKAVTTHELLCREAAVRENLELRARIIANAELINRVRRQIQCQQAKLCASRGSVLSQGDSERMVFQLLNERIPGVYERTKTQQYDPRSQLNGVINRVTTDEGLIFDCVCTHLFPFEMAATADLVWHWLGTKDAALDFNIAHRGSAQQDVMQVVFAGESQMLRSRIRCHGNIVFRRFDEPNRVVIVTTAIITPEQVNSEFMGDISVHISQWIAFSRVMRPDANSGELCEQTHVVRRDISEVSRRPPKAELLQHAFADGMEWHQGALQSCVETKLLGRSTAAH